MRRNVIILVLVLVLVSVLYYVFIFRNQTEKIDVATQAAQTEEDRVQSLRLELNRLEDLKARAPELRERFAKMELAIPTADAKPADFILQLQEAADDSGIEWLSVSLALPAQSSADAAVFEISSSLSVTGGYFQVQDFLVRLETLSRAAKIGSVSLSPGELDDLSSALTLRVFTSAPAPAGS